MNTKEQVEHWDVILDQYETSIGLPQYKAHQLDEQELESYFSMSRDTLEKLTPDDCGQISYRLAQFAFHIQRTLNREIARHNWAEEGVKETIADEINNYKGYGYIEKSCQAIKHNEKATTINKVRKYCKQRMDRLSYLANSIKNLSDILMSIHRNKVKNGSQ